MSKQTESISRARDDLKLARLGIDVALDRAEQWMTTSSWLQVEARGGGGGTTSGVEERKEKRMVVARATNAVGQIPHLLKQIEAAAKQLRAEVAWLTASVDSSNLPPQDAACKSCARTGEMGKSKIGGHFSPVWEGRSKDCCRWCAEYREGTGQLPPLEAVELYHSQSPRAAGLWLARLAERKTA